MINITITIGFLQIAATFAAEVPEETFSACSFSIKNALVASGPCKVSAIGDDSSYVGFDNEYVFVYLLRGEAEGFRGYWNEYESHAHTPIGMLSIDGNCWSGEMASLCLK
jgi:hypothetical protein